MHTCDSIVRNANSKPDSVAIIDSEFQCTWAELLLRVRSLAAGLNKLGCAKGDRVAIVAGNSYEGIELTFAVQWLGAVIVPINTRWSADEIGFALEDCSASIVIISSQFSNTVLEALEQYNISPTLVMLDKSSSTICKPYDELFSKSLAPGFESLSNEEVASIFYTGGTTGRSKGVMLTHVNHVFHSIALAAEVGIDSKVTYLHAAPMFHIADSLFTHLITLVGATHVVARNFDPVAILGEVEKHQVTDTILVPTMIQMLYSNQKSRKIFGRLTRLFYGASPMPEAALSLLQREYPELDLLQLYGQTESSPVLTLLSAQDHRLAQEKLRSAGKPIYGTAVNIINESGQEVGPGVVGEIVANGLQVMAGYWQRELETKQALSEGWLHTGDAGYLDEDGYLYVTDRIKDMIISGGENVYSVEVEQAIYKFPGVAQCAVVGLPHEKWGEEVVAIVVLSEESIVEERELKNHCTEILADYKCPKKYVFRSELLPVSGAGKILKRELRVELTKKSLG